MEKVINAFEIRRSFGKIVQDVLMRGDKFIIERSADGLTFSGIGTVTANNRAGDNSYSFSDGTPLNKISYYRLKMIDRDGSFTYSRVVKIVRETKSWLAISPNPAHQLIHIAHPIAAADDIIYIIGNDGRKMIAYKPVVSAIQSDINISKLAGGSYEIIYTNGNHPISVIFIKE